MVEAGIAELRLIAQRCNRARMRSNSPAIGIAAAFALALDAAASYFYSCLNLDICKMDSARPSRKDRSRNQILDAALIEFEQHGVGGASMEALAARAGLTRATVYNLFPSKEDIAFAIVHRASAQWQPAFRKRLDAGESARTLLHDALLDAACWHSEHPNIAMATLLLTLSTDTSAEAPVDRMSFRGLLRDVLALGQKQRVIRSDHDPMPLACIVLGLFIPTVLYALKTGKALTTREIDWLLQLTIEGIGARSKTK